MRLLFVVVVVVSSLFVAASPARAVEICYDFTESRVDNLVTEWFHFYVHEGLWIEGPPLLNRRQMLASEGADQIKTVLVADYPHRITSVGINIYTVDPEIMYLDLFAQDHFGQILQDTTITKGIGLHSFAFEVQRANLVRLGLRSHYGQILLIPTRITMQIVSVCFDEASAPTATPTPPLTWTPLYTPTPFTITPTPSRTPTQTRTLFPTVIGLGTLDSGPFRTAEAVSGECRDIRNPCPILPVAAFPTLNLASPTPAPTIVITQIVTSTPTPSPTGLYTPGPPTNTPTSEVQQIITLVDNPGNLQIDLYDAEGTPVGAQTAYKMGSAMGGLFRLMRAAVTADLGPAGWIVSLMVGAIGIQIFFRVMLYFIPVFRVLVYIIIQILNVLIPG